MLHSQGLKKMFWVESICCVNYILNWVSTKATLQVTPEEKWSGLRPHIHNFKVSGYQCWAHILDER
jgi:hypothetical protein